MPSTENGTPVRKNGTLGRTTGIPAWPIGTRSRSTGTSAPPVGTPIGPKSTQVPTNGTPNRLTGTRAVQLVPKLCRMLRDPAQWNPCSAGWDGNPGGRIVSSAKGMRGSVTDTGVPDSGSLSDPPEMRRLVSDIRALPRDMRGLKDVLGQRTVVLRFRATGLQASGVVRDAAMRMEVLTLVG